MQFSHLCVYLIHSFSFTTKRWLALIFWEKHWKAWQTESHKTQHLSKRERKKNKRLSLWYDFIILYEKNPKTFSCRQTYMYFLKAFGRLFICSLFFIYLGHCWCIVWGLWAVEMESSNKNPERGYSGRSSR